MIDKVSKCVPIIVSGINGDVLKEEFDHFRLKDEFPNCYIPLVASKFKEDLSKEEFDYYILEDEDLNCYSPCD